MTMMACRLRQFVLFGFGIWFAQLAMATNYSFPSNMPVGCSNNGGGNYTCGSISLNWGDTIAIGYKPASITVNGNLSLQNAQINIGEQASDLSLIVNGTLSSNTGAAVVANLSVNGAANLGYQNQITGNVKAGSLGDGGATTYTGNVTVTNAASFGYGSSITGNVSAASVSDGGQVTYGGSITASGGAITLQFGDNVAGNVTDQASSSGRITLNSATQVSGCVETSTNAPNSINLGWFASVGGVCCLSGNSCGTSCVSNGFFGAFMPPVCSLASASPLVLYHMDEAQWTGATGQVVDSSGSGYNATAVNGATTANTSPALAGNPGTCGYGAFNPNTKQYYVALPANFPHLTTDFTITAWINTLNNRLIGQRIFEDDQHKSGGYGFSLGDNGANSLRFYARGSNPITLDSYPVINNNVWYFVAAVANISGNSRSIYIFNQSGGLVSSISTPSTGWGTDTGTVSIGGEVNNANGGENKYHFDGSLDEVQVFSGALSESTLAQLALQTHPCTNSGVAIGGFNAYDVTTPAGAVTGNITTKIAGEPFGTSPSINIALVALNTSKTAIQTGFVGPVKVDLLDSSGGGVLDSNGCNANWPLIQTSTATFVASDNGVHAASITEPNVWQNVRVRVSYPATGTPTNVGCSTDNFAIRPYSFYPVSASDQDWATAGTARPLSNTNQTGGNVHQAGRPFTLGATAINAAGTITSNYAGSPSATLITCVLPLSGCAPGTLASGSWSAASGVVTSNTATYTDAGAISVQLQDSSFAQVDANDSTATQMTITSAAFKIGRFVPDHFDLVPNTPKFMTFNASDAQCNSAAVSPKRSFTYIGQPFGYLVVPQATLTARYYDGNTASSEINDNNIMRNYTNTPVPTAVYAATPNGLDTSATSLPVVNMMPGTGGGVVSVNPTDLLAFVRSPTAPQAPFNADITLNLSVADSSESSVSGNGVINTLNAATYNGTGSGMAFDSGNLFYYGRLSINNANGAVNLSLPVPVQAQYWNGSNFVTNTYDNCTAIAADNVAMGNYQLNLTPCETAVSLSSPLLNGSTILNLGSPGATHNGSVDLTVNLAGASTGKTCLVSGGGQSAAVVAGMSWLQGKWSGSSYTVDPVARATFGVYRNANQFIFMQEKY